MRLRLLSLLTALFALAPAASAWAHDNGEGILGETDDKVVTFFSLGVCVFFVLVVVLGSHLQSTLEKRKEARKAAEMRGRVGW